MNKKLLLPVISTGVVLLPTGLAISCGNAVDANKIKVRFDQRNFSSKSTLETYLKNKYTSSDADGDKWSLYNGSGNKYFNSIDEVYKDLDKYIDEMDTYLPNDLTNINSNGRIVNYPMSDNIESLQKIYKGKENNFYLSEDAAINSLVQTHQAYRYNGIYFRSKDDFKAYLVKSPDVLKDFKKEFKFVEFEDGSKTQQYKGTTEADFKSFITPLVNSNVKKSYKKDGNLIPLDDKDISSKIDDADIPYIKVKDTGGKAEYDIDISKDTPGSLIGPEVLNTETDPTSLITDIKQWHGAGSSESPTNFTPASIAEEKMLDFQLSTSLPQGVNYISDLLKYNMDDKDFLALYNNGEQNDFSMFNDDLNKIKVNIKDNENIGLFNGLKKIEERLSEGKNYGFLTSISILRSWLINKAFDKRLSLDIFDEINKAFDFATRILNFQLHKRIDFILSDKAKKFDISKVFGFNGLSKASYGEMPKTYLQRFIGGKDAMDVDAPEATEIILSVGLLSGILGEIDSKQKNKDYSIPESFDKLLSASANNDLLKTSVKIWNDFEKNDHLNTSTYKLSSSEYKQNTDRISKLLSSESTIMKAYNKSISTNNISMSYDDFIQEKIENSKNPSSPTATGQKAIAAVQGGISIAKDVIDVIENVAKICEDIEIISGAGEACPVLLIATIALNVICEVVSAILGTENYDLKQYQHQDNAHQEYLWNGASHKEHTFFGIDFGATSKVGLSSLKILTPIKIMSSSVCDIFYYNKKEFTSFEEVKKQYINDLKNGTITSNKVVNSLRIKSPSEDKVYSGKLGDIINDMWSDKQLIFSTGYISDGGISYNGGSSIYDTVTKILDDIKPITIIELPSVDHGELKYPGEYRMPITNKNYLYGTPKPPVGYVPENKYWVFDPNIKQKPTQGTTTTTPLTHQLTNSELMTRFKKSYHIENKEVLKYEILKNQTGKYNDIDRIISTKVVNKTSIENLKTVFQAKAFDGEVETFLNKGFAYKWLLNKMKFTFINVSNKSIYSYKGKTFLSMFEFMDWIMKGVSHA